MYLMTGTPEGSTDSGFMEKPIIEPATPGLQDIGLAYAKTWSGVEPWSGVMEWCGFLEWFFGVISEVL